MRDLFDMSIRITTYSLTYDLATVSTFPGAINQYTVSWSDHIRSVHNLHAKTFAAWTLKCVDAGAMARVYERSSGGVLIRVPYWEWNWEFRYRPEKWTEEVLDRGLSSLPGDGMPTGEHAVGENYPDELADGEAAHIPVVDSEQRRVPELMLFDGKGYPLLPRDARWETGYYFEWRKDKQLDFAYPTLPFNFFTLA
jgi:hypothetical protein